MKKIFFLLLTIALIVGIYPQTNLFAEDKKIISIKVEKMIMTHKPNKTEYYEGEYFDRTGLVITAYYTYTYEDGSTEKKERELPYNSYLEDNYRIRYETKNEKLTTSDTFINIYFCQNLMDFDIVEINDIIIPITVKAYETKDRIKSEKTSIKNFSSNKGKLNITKYGISRSALEYFYLDGYKLSPVTKEDKDNGIAGYENKYLNIKDIINNTGYKLYKQNEFENSIDLNKDKEVYDNLGMYLRKKDVSYLIWAYTNEFDYVKDMYFLFAESKRYGNTYKYFYIRNLQGTNDYYLKKVFSIKNAPSLNNFKKEFKKKLSGEGKNLVKIEKYGVGYKVTIPYIRFDQQDKQYYLTLIYKYDRETRRCIEIDWSSDYTIPKD